MTESRDDFLVRLKGLAGSGAPWHQIGAALRTRPEIKDLRSWRQLLVDAQRETGIASVMLTRYVALLKKLDLIAPSPAELSSLMPRSFTAGEIAVRLYYRNQEKGLQALKDLRARQTNLEKIRDDLSKEPLSGDNGRAIRAKAIADAETMLTGHAERLFGAGSSVTQRSTVPHLCRIGFEVFSPEGERFAGIDLYLPNLSKTAIQDPLEPIARSIVLSTYFPQFYLMFAPGFSEEDLTRAEAILDAFGSKSIGMIFMPDENSIRQYREATARSDLDRSASYQILADRIRDSTRRRPDHSVDEDDETPGPRLGM
jgi:hypothetical protein